jgi:hypothetical protein
MSNKAATGDGQNHREIVGTAPLVAVSARKGPLQADFSRGDRSGYHSPINAPGGG